MHFEYLGPEEIMRASSRAPRGTCITSREALFDWLRSPAADAVAEQGWATYVVNLRGDLLLAPRRSEHVACAGGAPVLAAGEIQFDSHGEVLEVTNHSTGYCPSEDCWEQVRVALDRAGLASLYPPMGMPTARNAARDTPERHSCSPRNT